MEKIEYHHNSSAQYPTHHPTLAHQIMTEDSMSSSSGYHEAIITTPTDIPYNSSTSTIFHNDDVIIPVIAIDEHHTTHHTKVLACMNPPVAEDRATSLPPAANGLIASVNKSFSESRTTGVEEDPMEIGSPVESMVSIDGILSEPPNSEDQEESVESLSRAESHIFWYPKVEVGLLTLYLVFLGFVSIKLKEEKHVTSITTNPFVIFSMVDFAMAFFSFCAKSCIYEHLENPNSSPPNQYLRPCYKFFKFVFYILCPLALFSLLPPLFTPHPN